MGQMKNVEIKNGKINKMTQEMKTLQRIANLLSKTKYPYLDSEMTPDDALPYRKTRQTMFSRWFWMLMAARFPDNVVDDFIANRRKEAAYDIQTITPENEPSKTKSEDTPA